MTRTLQVPCLVPERCRMCLGVCLQEAAHEERLCGGARRPEHPRSIPGAPQDMEGVQRLAGMEGVAQWAEGMPLWALCLCAVAVVALLALCATECARAWKLRRLSAAIPVVSGGVPLLGHLLQLIGRCPWDQFARWSEELGSIYRVTLFGRDILMVSEPALLEEMMQKNYRIFVKDESYKALDPLLGTGIVTSNGTSWSKQRVLVSAAFRIDMLEDVPDMARRAVLRLAEKFDRIGQGRGAWREVDIGEDFRHLTLEVIAEALLSLSPVETQTFARLYLPIVEECHRRLWYPWRFYLPTATWFQHRANIAELNAFITKIIEDRWQLLHDEKRAAESGVDGSGDGHSEGNDAPTRKLDVLDKILGEVMKNGSKWDHALRRQLRDQVKTFVLAGHETSATMLGWALYECLNTEGCAQRVREEAEEIFGELPPANSGDDIFPALPPNEELRYLEYTLGALKEALRLYSIVPIVSRSADKDVQLGPHFIPAGTNFLALIQGVHHRADLWPEPQAYKPERFLHEIPTYNFLPFVAGPRNCLGQHLSLLESKVVLALLLQRYDIEIVDPEKAGEKHPFIIPIVPQHGLRVRVRERASSS